MLLKAMPLRTGAHDSETEVEVLAPILCCSTVTVEESEHTINWKAYRWSFIVDSGKMIILEPWR